MASNNYAFLSNGILSIYTYENEGVFGAIESVAVGNTSYDFNVSINTTSLTIQNTTTVFTLKSPNTFQINSGTYYLNANGSWVIVSGGPGGGITQIETSNGIGGGTITNTGILYIIANTGLYVNTTGIYVNDAYINTISSNSASYLGGNTAASLKGYSDNAYSNAVSTSSTDASTKAGTAYTNAVSTAASDATSKADAAYTNAVSIAASDATSKADAAYTNALTIAAGLYVNTSQLSSNLANYQTTAGLPSNVAILTANNANYLGGNAAANFVQNTDSRVLSGNLNFTGTNTYFTSGLFVGSNLVVNTSILFIGNSTVNTIINSSALAVNSIIAAGSLGNSAQVLTTNSTGVYWANAAGGSSAYATEFRQQYTANGTQTDFTVTSGYVANQISVYLNGVLLRNGTDVNVASGSVFSISPAPNNGSLIDAIGQSTLYANGISTIVSQQFTANGTANSFTITSGYIPNQVQVYLNGVKQLPNTDVIITSGNTVNFINMPANNAIVDVYGYQTSVSYSTNNLIIGNVSIGTDLITVGNSTVNTQINAGNVFLNGSRLVVGNTSTNVSINATSISVGNSTVNTVISNGNISINGSNVSPVQSFRNKIINGNFDIWQRGTSTSINGAYCADRWNMGSSGSTFTTSLQSFTVGQTDVPNEPFYFHRTVVTSSAGASNYVLLQQPIESVRTFAGKTVTLSFYAKANASKNISLEFMQYFGTGGSPSATVNTIGVTTFALTTTWTKYTVTVSIPSISGKTIGSNGNDYLSCVFWFNAGSTYNSRTNSLGQTSGTYDISQVQLEEGSVATPFEMRPIAMELTLCQRYCQVIAGMNIYATATNPGSYNPDFYFPVSLYTKMRANPSFTRSSVSDSGVTVSIGGNAGVFYVGFEMWATVAQSTFNLLITAEL